MKIITLNLNGIRSAAQKGFLNWARLQQADIICVQELKAQRDVVETSSFMLDGYTAHFHYAEKKGYSGVGVYSRLPVKNVTIGLGFSVADTEGRHVGVQVGDVFIASLYLPSGTSGDERQTVKYDFLNRYENYLASLHAKHKKIILCGDWNIAHKEIDLKNWRGNKKNSGFLPEERAWMDKLFGELKFIDAFREVNREADQYTWWSNRGQARAKNVGWRIDYQVVSQSLKQSVKSAAIYTAERFSDHAPLIMDYEISLI